MDYQWNIVWVKTVDYPNMPQTIHAVRMEYIGTDEAGRTGQHEMLINFPQPHPDNFVPFENISEEDIISWFVSSLSQDHWEHIHENIGVEIQAEVTKHDKLPLITA